jgi:hypothetical protein
MARTFKLGSIVVKVSRKSLTVTTDKAAKAASRANARKNARLTRQQRTIRRLREEVTAWEEGRAAATPAWTYHRVAEE